MQRSGLRTEHCGIPGEAAATANDDDQTRMKNDLSDRYDLIHLNDTLHIAKSHSSHFSKIL